jgi:hypothetical protein
MSANKLLCSIWWRLNGVSCARSCIAADADHRTLTYDCMRRQWNLVIFLACLVDS